MWRERKEWTWRVWMREDLMANFRRKTEYKFLDSSPKRLKKMESNAIKYSQQQTMSRTWMWGEEREGTEMEPRKSRSLLLLFFLYTIPFIVPFPSLFFLSLLLLLLLWMEQSKVGWKRVAVAIGFKKQTFLMVDVDVYDGHDCYPLSVFL